jgi:hypothetical protein
MPEADADVERTPARAASTQDILATIFTGACTVQPPPPPPLSRRSLLSIFFVRFSQPRGAARIFARGADIEHRGRPDPWALPRAHPRPAPPAHPPASTSARFAMISDRFYSGPAPGPLLLPHCSISCPAFHRSDGRALHRGCQHKLDFLAPLLLPRYPLAAPLRPTHHVRRLSRANGVPSPRGHWITAQGSRPSN